MTHSKLIHNPRCDGSIRPSKVGKSNPVWRSSVVDRYDSFKIFLLALECGRLFARSQFEGEHVVKHGWIWLVDAAAKLGNLDGRQRMAANLLTRPLLNRGAVEVLVCGNSATNEGCGLRHPALGSTKRHKISTKRHKMWIKRDLHVRRLTLCHAALSVVRYRALGDLHEVSGSNHFPVFQVDSTWPKPLPNHQLLSSVIGVALDSRDHVWIVHRAKSLQPNEIRAGRAGEFYGAQSLAVDSKRNLFITETYDGKFRNLSTRVSRQARCHPSQASENFSNSQI